MADIDHQEVNRVINEARGYTVDDDVFLTGQPCKGLYKNGRAMVAKTALNESTVWLLAPKPYTTPRDALDALEWWRATGAILTIRVDHDGYTITGVDAVSNEYVNEVSADTLPSAISLALYQALKGGE